MKKVKISELPLASTLRGLFTLGTDNLNRSVKVSLEFVEENVNEAVEYANTAAQTAQDAASAANIKASNAQTAADNADAKATLATNAATNANEKASLANTAASNANTKATIAQTAASNANAKAVFANAAAQSANDAADNANEVVSEWNTPSTGYKAKIEQSISDTEEAIDDAEEATDNAQTAAEDATAAKNEIQAYFESLVPSGLSVISPTHLTIGNTNDLRIIASLTPSDTPKNIVYISDNRAVDVLPDGRLIIVGKGNSRVHVIPSLNASIYKTINITVSAPVCSMVNTRASLRFIHSGAFRLY